MKRLSTAFKKEGRLLVVTAEASDSFFEAHGAIPIPPVTELLYASHPLPQSATQIMWIVYLNRVLEPTGG